MRTRNLPRVSLAATFLLGASALLLDARTRPSTAGDPIPDPAPVDFNRDVRPILAEKCLLCHGPDGADREADLRLDRQESVLEDRGGYAVVVPGDSASSELYLRIADDFDPMPPEDAGVSLTPGEVELLRRWIDEGAPWAEHWAYVAPERPDPPAVRDRRWPRGPLDRFVLARIEEAGLAPEAEASPVALLRRASLDLTGLPPSVEELDRFLADEGEGAFERAVDRLLASPRYGEHMARGWLDAARYGDTHGFHLDNERALWRWRDWVIDAFNANKPFDVFTVEQLAGDLLPDPSLDQLVATGFNRCNPTTGEGGLIAEEYLVKYAIDRVETTSTVFLGSTLGCAQCHDHKYDPFSQEDFYRFFAFFHSFAEEASDQNALTPPPSIAAPLPHQAEELARLAAEVDAVRARLDVPMPEADAAQRTWERDQADSLRETWHVLAPLSVASTGGSTLRILDDASVVAEGEDPARDVYEVLAQTDAVGIRALHFEALTRPGVDGAPASGIGRASHANFVLSGFEVEALPVGRGNAFAPVPLASVSADYSQANYSIDGTLDDDPTTGWAVARAPSVDHTAVFVPAAPLGAPGGTLLRIRLRFESAHPNHNIGRFRLSVSTTDPAPATVLGPWRVAGPFPAEDASTALTAELEPEDAFRLDHSFAGGRGWEVRPDLVDGKLHTLPGAVSSTLLARTLHAPDARDLWVSLGSDDAVAVFLNGERLLENDARRPLAADQERVRLRLREGENRLVLRIVNAGGPQGFTFDVIGEERSGLPLALAQALVTAPEARTDEQVDLLRDHYRARHVPAWREAKEAVRRAELRHAAAEAEVPRTMITRDLAQPRPTYVLERGRYDQPGREVTPGIPAVLPALGLVPDRDEGRAMANRLDLAHWLTDPAHPLTARVTVNRLWQSVFGVGLVDTSEDFGTRGNHPSHPELLDWLAVEFVESGWDVKGFLRMLVTSSTYRQSSRVQPEKLAADPDNRLLARGARYRLDAEVIRDTVLATSGLLVERVGGPSVRPYQPQGLWKAVAYTSSNTANFAPDSGDALYRRGLYTFWKRTSPPPTMAIFDAPTRESCTVKRSRTNTPLQALALMNDVQFVEAARAFAERVLREADPGTDARLVYAFRSATSRRPDAEELAVLRDVLAAQREVYRADPDAARALLGVGDSEPEGLYPVDEVAAWTLVGSLVLNLDETVTRG